MALMGYPLPLPTSKGLKSIGNEFENNFQSHSNFEIIILKKFHCFFALALCTASLTGSPLAHESSTSTSLPQNLWEYPSDNNVRQL